MNGYIRLFRKSLTSSVFSNAVVWKVWCWCLMRAAHEKHTMIVGRQEIELMPGQFITGRFSAVAELGDISESQLRSAQGSLKLTNRIAVKTTNKFSIITIVNWEQYQHNDKNTTNKTTNKASNKQPTNNQQTSTNKNDKNDKNDKNKYIAPPSSAPFVWDDYLLKMMEDKQRQIRVIAKFFSFKGIRFDSVAETRIAIKRHLRAAKDVGEFTNEKIMEAMKQCSAMRDIDWTLETTLKVLTK